jgi:predicted unusual protein kinase regulating ubiquinone biosynthesis (AarF/ABC1/UbiB family)
LFDWIVLGKLLKDDEFTALRKNEPRRAKEALILCEQLGPTFIKLGQALSIRTDLLPELYALELRQLQDAVPPFDNEEAKEVLRRELGVKDLSQIFATLSDKPVASASIGQVYRGTLKDGTDVAVKVQRPGILGEIALDLHALRLLTPIQTTLQNLANGQETVQEDIDQGIALVDEWGRGFVAETDYRLEAENTIQFEAAMRKRNLDAVCAPKVVDELVRDKVLVTEWVEGTRLDRDASSDVPRLCGVAINAYLTMLLDTGTLHCDPHPGNLLRTTDGKLCILDWGMTLDVPDDLQYALLEFIAHINTEDYDSIPQDFINLGFSPEDVSLERLQSSGITEGLSFAFRQLSKGGGPAKMQERVKEEFQDRYGADLSDIELRDAARAEMLVKMEEQLASEGVDVKGVTNVMEEMSKRNRELFALPPYVLYVARAFSTLEGIGLSIDENYSIVQECYPYLAGRLFTDKSPRAKSALRAMLGLSEDSHDANLDSAEGSSGLAAVKAGVSGSNASEKSNSLSPKKLMEMTDNFASYTAATATVDRDGEGRTAAVKEFAKVILDKDGSALQEILVEEAAKLGDAATRNLLRQALVESAFAKTIASSLRAPKDALERSEQLASLLPENVKKAIIDSPADFPRLVDELLYPTSEDERILSTARELQEVLGGRIENNSLRGALADNLSDGASMIPSIPDISPGVKSIVSDEETRDFVLEQLSNVPSLGRRIGAGLFRRAAYRAMKSPGLPEEARKQLSDVNNRLADAIEPEAAVVSEE